MIPVLNEAYTSIAVKLTRYENHETLDARQDKLNMKIAIMNFLLAYLSIFMVAFLYIPYGGVMETLIFRYIHLPEAHKVFGTDRLVDQVFYFGRNFVIIFLMRFSIYGTADQFYN